MQVNFLLSLISAPAIVFGVLRGYQQLRTYIAKKILQRLETPVCIIDRKSQIIWKNKTFAEKFDPACTSFETEFEPKKILHHIQIIHKNTAWIIEYIKLHNHFAIIFQSVQGKIFNWWQTFPFPIAILNSNSEIEQGNDSFENLIGQTRGHISQFTQQFDINQAGSTDGQELVWKSKLGVLPILTWSKNYGDDKLIVLENRTEFIKLKNQAQEAQHLQIMGQLTCGIIHDFNNLLTAINGFSELLESTIPNNEMLNEIRRNTMQAANLAKELLNFVKMKTLEQNLVNPSKFLASRKTMLQKMLGEKIKLEININENETGMIDLSETQMEQIILNMSLNSKDAMDHNVDEGKLRIHLKKQYFSLNFKLRNKIMEKGYYFLLEISDTGNGIKQENIPKIFSAFFSTKEKGTGLGLASCMRIIEHIGGTIDFKTTIQGISHGTIFYIYMPVSQNKPDVSARQDANEEITSFKPKTLILVEDETVIKNLMHKTLSQAGYTIYAYSDGTEAIQAVHSKKADGLITDAILPGIDGINLTKKIQNMRPNFPILIVSGYSLEDLTYNLPNNVHYLEKPFTLKILKETVNKIFQ